MSSFPLLTGEPLRFDHASAAVVDYLKAAVPMGYWAVTRYDGERQVYLEVRDDAYGLEPGGSHRWADSLCRHMVTSRAPRVAPDARAVQAYRTAPVAQRIRIGSYVGIPIERADGALFGVLCGLDPRPMPDSLTAHTPMFELLAGLLGKLLEADLARTEHERALEQVQIQAERDPLTGLLNRRGWQEVLLREEDRLKRFGEPCAIFVLDLDDLKHVNDTAGHLAGDRLLARAAAALAGVVRVGDVVARLGGDEFAVLSTGTGPEAADVILTRLRATFDAPDLRASVGYAPFSAAGGFSESLAAADAAMYAEKALRREGRLRLVA